MATFQKHPDSSGASSLLPTLEVMLAWPTPNYTDPVTRNKAVLITSCVLGAFMLFVVGARMWARAVIQKNAGIDDWLMLAAMIPTIGLSINACLATERYAFDRHVWDVLPDLFVPARKITFSLYVLYVISGGMIKISILLFYRRLDSRTITRTFRIATWINIFGIACFMTVSILIIFLACRPWSAFWEQFDIQKTLNGYVYHCWVDESADAIAVSIMSGIQDAITAFLPTILYWNLQIPRRQKIALGAIFALGYSVCIVAAIRSYYVWRTFNDPLLDSTWESWPAWLLCVIETQLGAICASAPALKVFLTHYSKVATTKISSSREASSEKRNVYWFRSTDNRSTATSDGYLKEPGSRHTVDEQGAIVLQEWSPDGKNGPARESARSVDEESTTWEQDHQYRDFRPESGAMMDWEARRQPKTESMQTRPASFDKFNYI